MSRSLVFDARWLKTGIGRYTRTVLQGLREHLQEVEIRCIAQPGYADSISAFCDGVILSDLDIYTLQEQLVLPWLARKSSAFYAPHYNVPLLWRKRLLVTIHDLNHLLDATYRRSWKSRFYAKPLLKLAVEKADYIIAPSGYTKAMLHQHLRVASDRVTVIPGAVSAAFQPRDRAQSRSSVARDHGVARPYVLFVGNFGPNKNLSLLLQALGQLRKARDDAPILVIVGAGRGKKETQIYARMLGLHDSIVWLENLSDDFLAILYSAAVMTVIPSREEGFGMPVIESMACGTPVICSKVASLPEVGGDAVLFFSPYSSEALAAAMEKLMDSTEDQTRLIGAGLQRARMYSQERCARLHAGVVRRLLDA